jgi:hypothetical protein
VLCCAVPCHAVSCCAVLQESKSGPVSLHYSSAAEALAVPPQQLSINTHPMYHVLQGEAMVSQGQYRMQKAAEGRASVLKGERGADTQGQGKGKGEAAVVCH